MPIQTNLTKLLFAGALPLMTTVSVMAMTAGAEKNHWPPENVPGITQHEVHALKSAKCQITSYRDEDNPLFKKNTTGKPDEQDDLMLVRGSFAARGQNDLLVLCGAPDKKDEFFMIVWGGPTQCQNKISMTKASQFSSTRVDYYASSLKKLSSSEVMNFLEGVYLNPIDPEHQPEGSNAQQWVLKKQALPVFEHDSVLFSGGIGIALYCSGSKWVKLYDYHNDYLD